MNLQPFRVAFEILTVLPLGGANFPEKGGGRAVVWFPMVGGFLAAMGALFVIAFREVRLLAGASPMPVAGVFVEAILLVGLTAWLTGAFHLDGFADTCDGLGARRGREKALAIMRDSRIGSFGALGLFLLLLFKISLLAALPFEIMPQAFALALICGRWGMAISCARGEYARKDEGGLGAYFIENTHWKHAALASILPMIFACLLARLPEFGYAASLTALAAVLLAALWFTSFCTKRLGGITGDTLGACNEICEALVLLILYCLI